MRTLIFVLITLLSTPVLACEPGEATPLPTFEQVTYAISDFQSEVYGHQDMDGFRRYRNMFDVNADESRPIVDSWGAMELMTARHNNYTLMGYPARITTRNNSHFLGERAVKHFNKLGANTSKHFSIGPGAMMGKLVLAHEIAHTFGLNEVEADVFATAYAGHNAWDVAEYYLKTGEGMTSDDIDAHWANEKPNGDYLSPRDRLALQASVI